MTELNIGLVGSNLALAELCSRNLGLGGKWGGRRNTGTLT